MADRQVKVIILADASQLATELKKTKGEVQGVGTAAQSTSATSTSAMAGYERAASGAAAAFAQAGSAARIFSANSAAAGAAIRQAASALNVQIEGTRRFTAGAAQAGAEIRQQAASWAAQTAAAGQAGEKTSKLAEFFAGLKTAMGQTTNQISSQGTAWAGFDRIATSVFAGLAGPLGGLTVGIGLLITIGGALLSKLFELFSGTRELAEITKALVEKDIALANAFSQVARNGNDVDGSLQRQSESYKKILAADVSALLTVYVAQYKRLASAQDEQKKSNDRAVQATAAYNKALEENSKIAQGTLPLTGEVTAMVDYYAKATEKATEKQGKHQQEVSGTLEALKALHQAGVVTTEGLYAMARGAGADADAMARLRAEIETTKTAQDRFFESLAKQSAGFSTQSTRAGLIQQIIEVGANLDAVMKIPGETFHTAVLSQKGELEQIKKTIQEMTLTQAGYNAFVAELPKLLQDALAETDAISKGMKVFADHTKEAEAAARKLRQEAAALAKTTAQLGHEQRKSFVETQIAIAEQAGDWEKLSQLRQDLITEDFRFKVEKLTEENHATTQNLAALAFMEKDARTQRFIEDQKTNDQRIKDNERVMKALVNAEMDLAAEISKIRQKLLDDITKSNLLWFRQQNRAQIDMMKEVERVREQLLSRIRPGTLSNDQTFEINLRIEGAIEKLNKVSIAVSDVDKFFGSASRSVDQFEERVRILTSTNVSAIDTFKQMIDWQDVLTQGIQAFTSAIAGAIARTDKLGQALLRSFFQIIGSIAITLGTLFTLAAAGFIFLPGFQWSAGQLAAAGAALLVFGAVMQGVAARIGREEQQRATAGGTAGSSSAVTGTGRPERPSNVIPFPTSGSSSSQEIHVHLADGEGEKFLKKTFDGHGVITVESSKRKHRKALKQAVA